MIVGILADHLREVELLAPRAAHRHANKPLGVGRHKVHVLCRRELGGADAVALVLAVGGVGDESNLAATKRFKASFD